MARIGGGEAGSVFEQRAFDHDCAEDFSPSGRFVPVAVDGRCYWYFDQPDGEGGQKRRYVGPVDDPLISERVETFKGEKSDSLPAISYRRLSRPVSSGCEVFSSAQSFFNGAGILFEALRVTGSKQDRQTRQAPLQARQPHRDHGQKFRLNIFDRLLPAVLAHWSSLR